MEIILDHLNGVKVKSNKWNIRKLIIDERGKTFKVKILINEYKFIY